jgi:thymidylate synthase
MPNILRYNLKGLLIMLNINQCYLDFVDKILKTGKETYKDSNHHLIESLGNFYIIDDPFDLKFRAKYQNYTTEMMLDDIKSGKYDLEGCPIKSDALYQYVQSVEDPEIINNTQGFVYTYPNRIFAHFDVDQFESMKKRILTATGSNRAVAVTINPIEDAEEEDSDLELATGYSRDDLELMDSEERAEILEDAGYEPDDFGFDL